MWHFACVVLRAQEEERERRMDFVPEVSAVSTENIEVRVLGGGIVHVAGNCATSCVTGVSLE